MIQFDTLAVRACAGPSLKITHENIWNGIGKGKYKLSFLLWVSMWVRKK